MHSERLPCHHISRCYDDGSVTTHHPPAPVSYELVTPNVGWQGAKERTRVRDTIHLEPLVRFFFISYFYFFLLNDYFQVDYVYVTKIKTTTTPTLNPGRHAPTRFEHRTLVTTTMTRFDASNTNTDIIDDERKGARDADASRALTKLSFFFF